MPKWERIAKIIFFKCKKQKKERKTHIYFIYYNIIYLFFKFQKKNYKKVGETVPSHAYQFLAVSSVSKCLVVSSRVYRAVSNYVVSSRVSVSYRTVFRVVLCRVRSLNRVVPYSKKIKHGTFKTRHDTYLVWYLNRVVLLLWRIVRAVFSHDDTVLKT
jgi:hypothetical protein